MSHYSRRRRVLSRTMIDGSYRQKHIRHTAEIAADDTSSIAGRLHKIGFSNYRTYLQSGHWAALRLAYITRYGPACRECARRPVEIHHRTYAHLGAEPLTDLIALCGDCHEAAHLLARP